MNKTTLLPAPIANLKPLPTAATIRTATAFAIREEQLQTQRKLREAMDTARAKYKAAAVKYLRKHARTLEFSSNTPNYGQFEIGLSVAFRPNEIPELAPFRDAYRAAYQAHDSHKVQEHRDIARNLRAAAAGHSADPVAHLLADPKLKAALLAAGKKALTTPTQQDKATAIEA